MSILAKITIRTILSIVMVKMVWARGDLYTALSDLEPLLGSHKQAIDDLENYIHKEDERLNIIKTHLNVYKYEKDLARVDVPSYLGNPINAFRLIRRLTAGLTYLKKNIEVDYYDNVTWSKLNQTLSYPNGDDLIGAAKALTRLQHTYLLDAEELSEGKLNGVLYSTPMSAGDCYELARALYTEQDYKNALPWLNVSLRKYKEERKNYKYTELEIMEYIVFAYYMTNDVKKACEWILKIIKKDPQNLKVNHNLPHFQRILMEHKLKKRRRDPLVVEIEQKAPNSSSSNNNSEIEYWERYLAMCRGELKVPSKVSKSLYCRYLTENHPVLRLAPFKVEYYYRDPDIIVFHDVMSDDEIEYFKDMARPRLQCTKVENPKTGLQVPAIFRTGKIGWLRDNESAVVEKISRRVHHMTSLTTNTAEALQVVNYGIGGHYAPHHDSQLEDAKWMFPSSYGNRIATVLFYMSDVDQGGSTVFAKLGVSILPIKGTAVFWVNLHPSGEPDRATDHAACPVLKGSKWISTKWLHEIGQELIIPCGLELRTARKNPLPVPKSFR